MRLIGSNNSSIRELPGKIMLEKDSAALVESIVDVLEDRLRVRLSQCDPKPLGLATGRTMQPIYTALVSRLQAWPTSELERLVEGWLSFNLDEYVGLSESDSESFAAYMTHLLARPLKLTSDQVRIPNGRSKDPQKEAALYKTQLLDCGGLSIQLLGIGVNGHLGFNEPPCNPNCHCRVVNLSESTRKQNAYSFQNNHNLVPKDAITLGLQEILSAEEIHLIVTGSAKSSVLYSLFSERAGEMLPASWLRQHKNLYIWADNLAFSKVKTQLT